MKNKIKDTLATIVAVATIGLSSITGTSCDTRFNLDDGKKVYFESNTENSNQHTRNDLIASGHIHNVYEQDKKDGTINPNENIVELKITNQNRNFYLTLDSMLNCTMTKKGLFADIGMNMDSCSYNFARKEFVIKAMEDKRRVELFLFSIDKNQDKNCFLVIGKKEESEQQYKINVLECKIANIEKNDDELNNLKQKFEMFRNSDYMNSHIPKDYFQMTKENKWSYK